MKCPCCSDLLVRQFRRDRLSFFCHSCWTDYPILQCHPKPIDQEDKVIKPLIAIATQPQPKIEKTGKRDILVFAAAKKASRRSSLSNQLNAS